MNPTIKPDVIPKIAVIWMSLIMEIFFFPEVVVFAQTETPVTISSTDISQFPNITLDIYLSKEINSTFTTLTQDQVQILEDGTAIAPNTMNAVEPGLQTVLALNVGNYMAIDYRQQTLYQHVQKQILDWLELQSTTERDDFSFTSNSGAIISHVLDPQILSQSLSGFKPSLLAGIPSLQALASALTIASEPLPRATMQRAILYITVMPDRAALQTLPSLTDQATSLGVKVFVWLIAPADMAGSQNALSLVHLAEKTGGDFFLYSGPELLPNLDTEFSALRSFFQIQYSSLVTKSGTHEVSVKIFEKGNEWNSAVQSFQINLLPPNVFFFSPAISVHRIWQQTTSSKTQILTPTLLTFQIKLEFPDGHPRSLTKTEFLVDGKVIQELTQEPYDAFNWDISKVENGGEHLLQVQGEDILGFKFQTVEMPFEIQVDPPPVSVSSKILGFVESGPVLATIIGLTTIAAILTIFYRTNRNLLNGKRRQKPSPNLTDPFTQQVIAHGESNNRFAGNDPYQTFFQSPAEKLYARLVRLSEITQDTIPDAILYLSDKEVTFGSDPRIVSIGIMSPSVSPIHARIQLNDTGTFTITDLNSTAGTWVNFAPVSAKGATIESGDLVHIGKLLYRFEVLNRPLV